ncbi:hypothetical protein BKA63DRAFT_526863 [Paraphoma chrysanthemicola]|nr:hypothetical protein BKA63DRAFT_526863 [Paraphoma chrysanthemicola]
MSTFVFMMETPSRWDNEIRWLEGFLATFPGEPAANTLVETVCFPNFTSEYDSKSNGCLQIVLKLVPNMRSLTIGICPFDLWVHNNVRRSESISNPLGTHYSKKYDLDQLYSTTISRLVLRKRGHEPPYRHMPAKYHHFRKEFPEHEDRVLRDIARALAEGFMRQGKSKTTTVLIDWASKWDSLEESDFEVIEAGPEHGV